MSGPARDVSVSSAVKCGTRATGAAASGISKETLPFPKGAFTRSKGDTNDQKLDLRFLSRKR
jgi:hypothetical protein